MIRRMPREGADRAPAAHGSAAGRHGGVETGGRHFRQGESARGLKLTAMVMAAVLVATLAFVAVQVFRLQSNVLTMPLNLGENQESALPVDSSTDPLQILVLGTDTQTGNSDRGAGGQERSQAGNSDVMMLVTLSADRENVTVVSFPRDLLVPLPRCVNPEAGSFSRAMDLGQLNGALRKGGPGCTVAAINDLTGLTIDHFMMADFDAVKELSSAVGGVEVCVQEPVEDTYSGLSLPAGTSEVEGDQALAFLRTRHSFGDGGDAGRIAAQQSFLASMARKVQDEGTLTNLPKVYSIAETITRNLTVNEQLSRPQELLKIADRLKDVDLGNISFVTVPAEPWVEDYNRLVLDEAAAAPLFRALRQDRGLNDTPEPSAPSPSTGSTPSPSEAAPTAPGTGSTPSAPAGPAAPTVAPASVPVLVSNATTNPDRGAEVQRLLSNAGYLQADHAEAVFGEESTQLSFGPGYEGAGDALAARFGVPESQVTYSADVVGIELLVGADFATGTTVLTPPLRSELEGQTADQVTCQASSGL